MGEQEEHRSRSAGVARVVQDFYERYPYPRPVDSLDRYRSIWQDRERRRADYHLFWPDRPYRENQCILIAGCGTSQAARHAVRWPDAQVTGIDFSATSVRCTEVLKRKYDLKNLRVHQLPLERVSDLGMHFDQIVCTGVLHHLADPDAGLSALRSALKPDGAMQLMLYAPYGRAGIYLLQEFCRRVGMRATEDGIRDLITALQQLPSGHPLENLLREAPDLRDEAALADALLHPQDRAYSVPQLFDFLQRGELTFGRWMKQAPYSPCCGVMAKIPQASRMAQLSLAEQYAATELFRGAMVVHSLVAYRNNQDGSTRQVSFAGDRWRRYIPIRMPDTICVQEHLPPGAGGVLINRNHTCKDLIMPINSTEKRWFDAIDGSRTTAEITEMVSNGNPHSDDARAFFERLWWHDQVVFDASR